MRPARPLFLALAVLATPVLQAADSVVGPAFLPGDDVFAASVGVQKAVDIAAGNGNYLMVWQDERAVLSGATSISGPLQGNETDIYALRLDAGGQPMDETPIVVCSLGHNQTKPRVAWNGTAWLVVFESERPDWYFFTDIVGVRIAANGAVLDADPIVIRPEMTTPANDYASSPSVCSDGVSWAVCWEDTDWQSFRQVVKGTRIDNNGTLLDPLFVTLYDNAANKKTRAPELSFAQGRYLLAWERGSGTDVAIRTLNPALQPLTAAVQIGTTSGGFSFPRIATDGNLHLVVSGFRAMRVSAVGVELDAAPIAIPIATSGSTPDADVAWTGTSFTVIYSGKPIGGGIGADPDIYSVTVGADGVLQTPTAVPVLTGPVDEMLPAIASGAPGNLQIAYETRDIGNNQSQDTRTSHLVGTTVGPEVVASAGFSRQEYLRFAEGEGQRLAVFGSRRSGSSRLLAQRMDAAGIPIDAVPHVIAEGGEFQTFAPSAAWNGTLWMVVWSNSQGAVGRRYDAALQPLDPQPVLYIPSPTGRASVGALGADFLITANVGSSGDISGLFAMRARGSDGAALDASPLLLSGNYALPATVTSFAGEWLVVWNQRLSHGSSIADVFFRRVAANGSVSAPTLVGAADSATYPDVAVGADRALIVYAANATSEEGVRGRMLLATGGFLGAPFDIAEYAEPQLFPAVTYDGAAFLVAWVDYRTVSEVEQLRGDFHLARVLPDGTIPAPYADLQLSSGPLPEDLPDVSAMGGLTIVGGCQLNGKNGSPEIQRIAIYRVSPLLPTPWIDLGLGLPGSAGTPRLCGAGSLEAAAAFHLSLDAANPSSPCILFAGAPRIDAPLLGGTLVPTPSLALPLFTSTSGTFQFSATTPPTVSGVTVYLQAWIADPQAVFGAAASNALSVLTP